MKKIYYILIMLFIFQAYLVSQDIDTGADATEIGIIEKLDEYLAPDIKLFDENNNLVDINKLIDKPTIITFVYFRCPGICSPLMDGIAEAIDNTDMKIGEDYQVFTISFDPRESYELAQRKKKNYLNLMKKTGVEKGWLFFTGDSANITKATSSTGFRYKQTGNDFVHAASLIVLSPEGKITRYLNGTYFLPFEFKMSIVEASKGQSGPTVNKILQYCYSYDPQGQQYVLNITRVAGILIIFISIIIFFSLAIKPLFRKKVKNTSH
ncbi:MAG: SCO family protein [Bacteroidales bacterium]|nr:SCO family protein [Bacteroidales bacterium]